MPQEIQPQEIQPQETFIKPDFITLSGTYFYLGANSAMDFSGRRPFTIEGWIGFTSLQSAAPIFSAAGEMIFGLTREGQLFVRRRFWDNPLMSAESLQPGAWHHVGVTCDGKTWRLFVHGKPSMRIDLDAVDLGTPPHIGTVKTSATLNCEVWNLRIWNLARTDPQMFQAMDSLMVSDNGLMASFFPEMPVASHLRSVAEPARSVA